MHFSDKHLAAMALACALGVGIGIFFANNVGSVESASGKVERAAAEPPPAPPPLEVPELGVRAVEQVVSGEVVSLEGVGVVRLLGVDTILGPGDKPVDPQVSKSLLQQMLAEKQVAVICDPSTADTGFKDENGAYLVYLMLEDGVLVNTELLARGGAVADLSRPYGRKDELVRAERDARWNGRGVWSGAAATAKLAPLPPSDLGRGQSPLRPLPLQPEAPKAAGKGDVLVTKDGRFHRSSCNLSKGGVVMSTEDAKGKNYLACPVCFASPRVKV